MGIFDKISQKIGNAIKETTEKNATGKTRELLESENNNNNNDSDNNCPKDLEISIPFSKDDSFEDIIRNAGLGDLWVAGYDNFRSNQNAKFANMFSGKNNLKFIICKDDCVYICKTEKNVFNLLKVASKRDIVEAKVINKMLEKSVVVKLNGFTTTIDVTENKEKLSQIQSFLK